MESQITSYITLVATSGVLSVFLCIYTLLGRKRIPAARLLVALTALQSVYIFAFAFELASSSLEEIKLWIVLEYVGIAFAPVLGLLLVMRYIGKSVKSGVRTAMFVIPAITLVMVATNDWHHLFYKLIYLRPNSATPMADVEVGYWYIVHGAYTFGCLLAGTILLLSQWKATKKAYRKQLITLVCGQFLPMTAAFVYLMGVTPDGMDPVPFVLCITSAMYIWAMVSTQMLTVAPIAKQSIFESMREGVIVLDLAERLIDYNGAVRKMLPALSQSMIGRKLGDVWLRLTGGMFPVAYRPDGMQETIAWLAGGQVRHYEVRSSAVRIGSGEQVGSLLMLIDVTEQKRLQDQLQQMAFYDSLTSILNRAQFIHRGRQMLEKARGDNGPMAILLFDIDNFKLVNDTYGHETGDKVIVHTVRIVQQELPADALFARYGGEEFVLALEAGGEQAAALAERLRSRLESSPAATGEAGLLSVTASFGAAERLAEGDTIETLLRHADAALYESKRNGRNRVTLAPDHRALSLSLHQKSSGSN